MGFLCVGEGLPFARKGLWSRRKGIIIITSNMAAVNGGSETMADFNKPVEKATEVIENQTETVQIDIPLSPDLAAEEAKREEIRAKIRTVSKVWFQKIST